MNALALRDDSRFIQIRLERFKKDLINLTPNGIVSKHVLLGDCYLLDVDKHFELRADIAAAFEIRPEHTFVVGSGKLGFSIAPDKRYRHFSETSDIDVAIVSDKLFDQLWHEVLKFDNEVGTWDEKRSFQKYLMNGWIRPDALPKSPSFPRRDRWWNYFAELSRSSKLGPYKITAGVYRAFDFLERYQLTSVLSCKATLELER
jgi:hypothetical protein